MTLGCDTAASLTEARLKTLSDSKYTFVGRYLSGSYLMDQAEAKRISKAGLFIVSIWEKGRPTSSAYFTDARGLTDAREAISAALSIKQPTDTPIYFAVDYDASASDISGPIKAYLQSVKKVFEENKYYYSLGLYGSGSVLNYYKNTFTYTWLAGAAAWNGSGSFTGWSIRQHDNNTSIGAFQIDKDESNGRGGGWKI